MTFMQIMAEVLGGDYYPTAEVRLRKNVPAEMWADISARPALVPPPGSPDWETFKSAVLNWLWEGHENIGW